MAKIESIADRFVDEWCHDSQDKDNFKTELIEMLADIHKEYIIASIRNEICGKNLHSQYTSVMSEIKDIKKAVKGIVSETSETLEKTKKEISEQLQQQTKSAPKRSGGALGPFGSAAAKKFAEENDIDPNTVVGTGKDGKITKTDLSKSIKDSVKRIRTKSGATAKTDSSKLCNGTTASGDPCKSSGKVNVKGKWYCNRHKSQAVVCENVEDDDDFGSYENKKAIDRFRDQSLKSLETVDDNDAKLNDMMESGDEDENNNNNKAAPEDEIIDAGSDDENLDEVGFSEDEIEDYE